MSSMKRWNGIDDTDHKKCTARSFLLSVRRQVVGGVTIIIVVIIIVVAFHVSIHQRQQSYMVLSMPPNYSFRNAARIAPFGFPDSSRTLPTTTTTTTTADPTNHVIISLRCSCGSVLVEFPYSIIGNDKSRIAPSATDASSMVDCHCPTCRRYHMAAFVRYLEIPANGVSVSGDSVVRYQDSCSEMGNVQRIYCRRCSSKLLTTRSMEGTNSANNHRRSLPPLPQQQPSSSSQATVLVNMGSIDNESVSKEIMEQWKHTKVDQLSPYMEASWARTTLHDINVNDDDDNENDNHRVNLSKPPTIKVTGGCTCGKCQYEFDFKAPSEMQHCYCNLCRQLSGGMFMTWVPVNIQEQNFRWTENTYVTAATKQQLSSLPDNTSQQYVSTDGSHIPLIRYTDIGKRHMCSQCGSNLSILYDTFDVNDYEVVDDSDDDDDRVIWLSAAGFDSIRFPFRVEPYISRLLHICCRFKPKWYQLPKDDGIPRIQDAS